MKSALSPLISDMDNNNEITRASHSTQSSLQNGCPPAAQSHRRPDNGRDHADDWIPGVLNMTTRQIVGPFHYTILSALSAENFLRNFIGCSLSPEGGLVKIDMISRGEESFRCK